MDVQMLMKFAKFDHGNRNGNIRGAIQWHRELFLSMVQLWKAQVELSCTVQLYCVL